MVFLPDGELAPDWDADLTDYGEKLLGFCRGAGLLVHDARFSDEDYPVNARKGHASPGPVFRLALRAGVSRSNS